MTTGTGKVYKVCGSDWCVNYTYFLGTEMTESEICRRPWLVKESAVICTIIWGNPPRYHQVRLPVHAKVTATRQTGTVHSHES